MESRVDSSRSIPDGFVHREVCSLGQPQASAAVRGCWRTEGGEEGGGTYAFFLFCFILVLLCHFSVTLSQKETFLFCVILSNSIKIAVVSACEAQAGQEVSG